MNVYTHCLKDTDAILSFDDGPNPYWTPKILDFLDTYDIKAVFFILGMYVNQYPTITRDIAERGHMIGNHTYSHKTGDFLKCHETIEKLLPQKPRLIRPPCFDYSTLDAEMSILDSLGYTVLEGTVDTEDYTDCSVQHVCDNIKSRMASGGIVTLHDGSEEQKDLKTRAKKTLEALRIMLPTLMLSHNFILPSPENMKTVSLNDFLDK